MLIAREVKKSYGDLPVLAGVTMDIGDDEIVALTGPSGCGKTTLLDIVAGLTTADGGSVDAGGARVGYVFQEDWLLPWLTVSENVAVVGVENRPEEVDELLAQVGLRDFAGFYPDALSGGMRQRCAIARAYHYRCDLLLMDEPFKSLDHALRFEMLELLMAMWRRRRGSVLFVTHDVDEALAVASRVVVLGERPARVRAEFTLDRTREVRDVRVPAMEEYRQRILDAIAGSTWGF